MVTRKPLPGPGNIVPAPLRQAANNPPYPTAFTMPEEPKSRNSFEHVEAQGESAPNGQTTRSRESSISSHGTWNSDSSDPEDAPDQAHQIPAALRPGPPSVGGIPARTAGEQTPAATLPTSMAPSTAQSKGSSELPASLRPGSHMASNLAPRQEPRPEATSRTSQSPSRVGWNNPYLANDVASKPYGQIDTAFQQPSTDMPPPKSPSEELAALALDSEPRTTSGSRSHPPPPLSSVPAQAPPALPPMVPPTFNAGPPPPSQQQLIGDHEPFDGPIPAMSPSTMAMTPLEPLQPDITGATAATALSRNPWQEDLDREQQAQGQNGRMISPQSTEIETSVQPSSVPVTSAPDSPRTRATKQRNEVYELRHINWYDAVAGNGNGALRTTPVMMQNANGPCPLLALVNALVLSTSDSEETSLVHTLRTREQVTLGLLLDSVSEELLRRNERTGKALPDISDLYSFLITLHTGMNVNPSFVNASPGQPGGFEQTREMQLYGAFGVPLIHGWTAPYGSATYKAFEDSARSFDEALNLQFLEEELEQKLKAEGLSREEQQVFSDLTTMKNFLTNYPTQLSDHGLESISSWLKPGQIAILFRNDHFCTVYKEPRKNTLMTLVTDMGYANHDEVVWESLVDVNGAMAELFSGDFRTVGAAPSSRNNSTAPISNPDMINAPSSSINMAPQAQPNSQAEQEDLDLALALQLQEEEEESSRREHARRQHEENEDLSRRFLERDSHNNVNVSTINSDQPAPSLPPRRAAGTNDTTAAAAPRVNQAAERTSAGTAPPPTYEQAASDMPYREAGSTPSAPRQGNALGALSALDAQRQQSAFAAQSERNGRGSPVPAPGYGRRRTYSRFGGGGVNGMQSGGGASSGGGPVQAGTYSAAQRMTGRGEEKCCLM